MIKYALALAAIVTLTAPAVAQHAHGSKGPNGGIMEDVAGVHAELITSGNTVSVNIFDEGSKPVATSGFTASALIIRGSDREAVTLTPGANNTLKGDAKAPVGGNDTVLVTLKTAAGKSGQARFKK